jgi:hypothetical protein
MALKLPDELKKEAPESSWGKMLAATPVVMAVVATLLAGLASSEMTRAQYDRAYAAQLQSKAGDQWGYFQAKKMRGAMLANSLEILEAVADSPPADLPGFPTPPPMPQPSLDGKVQAALDALANDASDAHLTPLLANVTEQTLANALLAAQDAARAYDATNQSTARSMDQFETSRSGNNRNFTRSVAVAKMRYNAARYDSEAKLNQYVAGILELQVRETNHSAERHQHRSGMFFFGMLAAQAAVIISTLALAARQKNVLWSVAAVAGCAAIIFAIYVYLKF